MHDCVLFPYEGFRVGQEKIYETVRRFLESNTSVLMIEAPTGIGKTSAILVPLLEKGLKVLWFCRTHREQTVVAREVSRVNEKFGTRFNVLIVKGIAKRCPIRDVRESCFPHQKCMQLRALGKCPYVSECPYAKQFVEAFESDVIVLTYAYLLNPMLRDKVKDYAKEFSVLVFDEAHHLMLPPEIAIPSHWLPKEKNFLRLYSQAELEVLQKGESELFEAVNFIISALLVQSKIYYKKSGDAYAFIDFSFHNFLADLCKYRKSIFVSATLPLNSAVLITSKMKCKVERLDVVVPLNARVVVFTGLKLPMKARKREAMRVAELIALLALLSKAVVFLPCRDYLEFILREFDFSGLNVTTSLEEFESFDRGVLLSVAGSREAEGIDVEAKVACVIGVPYARPDEYLWNIFKYYKHCLKKRKLYFYTLPAVVRAVQAVGRVLRKPEERKLIIFADERYLKLWKYFPEWLKNQKRQVIGTLSEITQQIVLLR